ncbi:MAG: hypothetical protein C0503_04115 [Gemmatimonas sp.]|nr:hypothetical protein [Gemmatimonas sp.]
MALASAVDSIATPLSMPRWLAEAADGSLVMYDRVENGLYRVERGVGDAALLSTKGAGPMEYRVAQGIVLGPGDSLWVMDRPGSKAIVLDSEARPVREQRSPISSSAADAIGNGWVRAISATGDWYGSARAMSFAPTFHVDDSASVIIWRRATGRTDTLARVGMRPIDFTSRNAAPRLDAFDPIDAWGVFRDGRVMVVRGRDYGIELIEPDGRVTRVGRGPTPFLPLTREDAELTRDSLNRARAEVLRMMPMNPMSGQAGATSGGRPPPALPDPLPANWPLLRSDEIRIDWQDRAWVAVRSAPRDTGGTRYDLFDRDGRYLMAVSVAVGGRVIGFGREAVFVAWPDADELQRVKRHPLPE